jgi:hypothetical protein
LVVFKFHSKVIFVLLGKTEPPKNLVKHKLPNLLFLWEGGREGGGREEREERERERGEVRE